MAEDTHPKLVVGLGEMLWDLLPTGAQLGGAVSNFAVMAARLGDHAVCASRLGNDDLGREALARLSRTPVDTRFLQMDARYPSGSVSVALENGQPEYVIHAPAAWDFLELTDAWLGLARRADAVCFGTLAQREPVARRTIQGFLAATSPACVRVFDVNLRRPLYSAEVIKRSLEWTTVLKMNENEMPIVFRLLGMDFPSVPPDAEGATPEVLVSGAQSLLERFPIDLVSVTMGDCGSLLVTRDQTDRHPGIATQVVDTIGAGDAFTAALTHYYLRKAPLAVINEAGNRWGAWVASQAGAMPKLDPATRQAISTAILRTMKR